MSKVLMESLKLDLPALAEMIRAKGRGRDTMLAHITPKEAALLKRRGGSGTINPDTGLPEFEDFGGDYSVPMDVAPVSPTYDVVSGSGAQQTFTPTQAETGVPIAVGPSYQPGGEQYAPFASAGGNTAYEVLGPYGQTTPYGVSQPSEKYLRQVGPATPTLTPTSPVTPGVVSPEQQAVAPTKQDQTSFGDKALKAITDPGTLARLGLVGALGAYGASTARKAGTQTQAATAEQKAIAQPYTEQGKALVGAAQRGELTPQSQQALAAYKAQQAQSVATRGGVGQQQADAAIANLYNNLLDNQYNYGLKIMQIGDNIALGAIRSGMQLDQQLQQSTNNFYTQLASIAAGGSGYLPVAPAAQPYRG